MGEKFPFMDLVILGLAASFLIYRLYQVLGRRTDRGDVSTKDEVQKKSLSQKAAGFFSAGPSPVTIASVSQKDFNFPVPQTVSEGLSQIKTADPTFDASQFLRGVREAFRMIVPAFSTGDLEPIKDMVSPQVYADFHSSVQERKAAGLTAHTTLVQVADADFKEARMDGGMARIQVEISSDQIYVVRDAEGRVQEGRPERVTRVVDIWTFQKNVRLSDAHWMLMATNIG